MAAAPASTVLRLTDIMFSLWRYAPFLSLERRRRRWKPGDAEGGAILREKIVVDRA
jgi:hypothetical protein